jgi:hypothetical protein
MIPAEQLRIGNIIGLDPNDPENIGVVLEVAHTNLKIRIGSDNHWYQPDDLYPLPLVEEWLEKFDFNSKYKSVHMHWNLYTFCIEQKSDVDDLHRSIPQEQVFYYGNIEVGSVHHLQNIYFAIEQKDLQVK